MAPPHKRRRLTDSSSQPSPAYTPLTLAEPSPTPTLSHTVEQLGHRPSLALIPRPVPQRIDEVHLQIQKKSIVDHRELHRQLLQRRQGTAVSSALDSTLTVTVLQWADIAGGVALSTINDDLGGTYGTTQTLTLVSSPLLSATTTSSSVEATSTGSSESTPSSTPSEGFIDSSPSGTGVSSTGASGTGSAASTLPSSAGVSAASVSGSSASNSTRTATTRSSGASASSTVSRASLGPGVFLATLSNGDRVTVTRSDEPYTTTFADDRVSTIAPSSSTSSDGDDSSRTITRTSDDDSSETQQSIQQQSTATSVNFVPGPNETQQSPATPAAGSISSTSSAAGGGSGGGTTAPPGTIAGGVVGGCAGLAVILVVALVLLRWWKRKAQHSHHALPPSSEFTPDAEISSSLRGQPGMAERAGLRPLVGAVPAFLRHNDRSSQPSAPSSERGFTRVSGRKLPSQFSAGMTSSSPPPPDMPLAAPGTRSPDPNDHERNLSATSFYRDSDGFYGGEGTPASLAAAYAPAQSRDVHGYAGPFAAHSPSPSESLDAPGGPAPEEVNMTLSPGPQRTPTVHRGGPYTMSPSSTVASTPAMPLSPAQPSSGIGSPLVGGFPGGGYAESETSSSLPDKRGSRFTEEV